ncbi:MAG: ABC transporter permease [Clostridia bacterium]|nr:ABC transporter permease [Clostridia bacterium]
MAAYVARRLCLLVLTLVGVATVVFLLMRLLPGDPVAVILGDYATPEAAAALRQRLGLDRPLWAQYAAYLGDVARGDFGRSLMTNRPVFTDVAHAFPYTFQLAIASIAVSVAIGVPAGIVSARRRNSKLDHAMMLVALLGVAGPDFWYGIMALLVFSARLGWFPVLGANLATDSLTALRYLALPSIVLGFSMAGLVARMTRSAMLDVLTSDYIRTAQAKGLGEAVVVLRHGLRNALIPIVTVVANNTGRLLGGTVVIEYVFVRPGLGQLLVTSIVQRDYPMVQGITLLFALLVVLVNLLLDLSYTVLDPRVRYQ